MHERSLLMHSRSLDLVLVLKIDWNFVLRGGIEIPARVKSLTRMMAANFDFTISPLLSHLIMLNIHLMHTNHLLTRKKYIC